MTMKKEKWLLLRHKLFDFYFLSGEYETKLTFCLCRRDYNYILSNDNKNRQYIIDAKVNVIVY